jgi:protein-tyrosine phosphatase
MNKLIYKIINLLRNRNILHIVNKIMMIDNHNLILPKLYLGNIHSAQDISFLKSNKIDSILNCTKDEKFHSYFKDKSKLRISVNDSRSKNNLLKFRKEIQKGVEFIDKEISLNKTVYVHCYWGLMRSSTVIAAYLIKKHNMKKDSAILFVKSKRPMALLPFYNFNDIL